MKDSEELITILTTYQNEYYALDNTWQKKYCYYDKRNAFNKLISTGESKAGAKSAVSFIFLNCT